jgi:hypothetical protein
VFKQVSFKSLKVNERLLPAHRPSWAEGVVFRDECDLVGVSMKRTLLDGLVVKEHCSIPVDETVVLDDCLLNRASFRQLQGKGSVKIRNSVLSAWQHDSSAADRLDLDDTNRGDRDVTSHSGPELAD